MNISERMTQQQFYEIILDMQRIGEQSTELKAQDLINEMKTRFLSVIHAERAENKEIGA